MRELTVNRIVQLFKSIRPQAKNIVHYLSLHCNISTAFPLDQTAFLPSWWVVFWFKVSSRPESSSETQGRSVGSWQTAPAFCPFATDHPWVSEDGPWELMIYSKVNKKTWHCLVKFSNILKLHIFIMARARFQCQRVGLRVHGKKGAYLDFHLPLL